MDLDFLWTWRDPQLMKLLNPLSCSASSFLHNSSWLLVTPHGFWCALPIWCVLSITYSLVIPSFPIYPLGKFGAGVEPQIRHTAIYTDSNGDHITEEHCKDCKCGHWLSSYYFQHCCNFKQLLKEAVAKQELPLIHLVLMEISLAPYAVLF